MSQSKFDWFLAISLVAGDVCLNWNVGYLAHLKWAGAWAKICRKSHKIHLVWIYVDSSSISNLVNVVEGTVASKTS